MKKRLPMMIRRASLFLAAVMVCSVVLTACQQHPEDALSDAMDGTTSSQTAYADTTASTIDTSADTTKTSTTSSTSTKTTDRISPTSPYEPVLQALANKKEAVYPKGIAYTNTAAQKKLLNSNPVDDKFIHAVQSFSWKTSSAILSGAKSKNANYSPVSLYMALAILGAGANGDTQKELFSLLSIGGESKAYLSTQSGNLFRRLYMDNEFGSLKLANSLWLSKSVAFKKEYTQTAVDKFYASLYTVDFTNKDTPKAISAWITRHTNGLLKPELEFDRDTMLAILNTIYFKDQWQEGFYKTATTEKPFTLRDGKTVNTSFMSKTEMKAAYTKGTGFTASSLALKNGGSMRFILPDKGLDVDTLLSSPEKMAALFSTANQSAARITYTIPKFSLGSKMKLKDTLQALDMTLAFTHKADFSGITASPAFVSDVEQQTKITVDEAGVEAAAYTMITIAKSARPDGEPVEFKLDRPFIFGIVSEDNVPLFIGVCNNPAAG